MGPQRALPWTILLLFILYLLLAGGLSHPLVGPDQDQASDQLGTQDRHTAKSSLRAFRGFQTPRVMRGSGCFGKRIDRIGSVSDVDCRVQRRP